MSDICMSVRPSGLPINLKLACGNIDQVQCYRSINSILNPVLKFKTDFCLYKLANSMLIRCQYCRDRFNINISITTFMISGLGQFKQNNKDTIF